MAESNTDGYLTVKKLAGYSDMSVRSLQRYLHHPVHPIPHRKIGRRVYVRKVDFDRWHEQFIVRQEPIDLDALADELLKPWSRT